MMSLTEHERTAVTALYPTGLVTGYTCDRAACDSIGKAGGVEAVLAAVQGFSFYETEAGLSATLRSKSAVEKARRRNGVIVPATLRLGWIAPAFAEHPGVNGVLQWGCALLTNVYECMSSQPEGLRLFGALSAAARLHGVDWYHMRKGQNLTELFAALRATDQVLRRNSQYVRRFRVHENTAFWGTRVENDTAPTSAHPRPFMGGEDFAVNLYGRPEANA